MLQKVLILVIYLFNSNAIADLIANGKVANSHEFPYNAHLLISCNEKQWQCGSSILNQRVLLTAAHCLNVCVSKPTAIIIRTGHSNLNKAKVTKHSHFVIHERFVNHEFRNDICVVFVEKDLILDKTVQRVGLVQDDMRERGYVTGWVVIPNNVVGKPPQPRLKYMEQNIMSERDCMLILKAYPDGIFCGFFKKKGKYIGGMAHGDSGNPLVIHGFIQTGLVSFRQARKSFITFYTSIPHHLTWIDKTIKKYCE